MRAVALSFHNGSMRSRTSFAHDVDRAWVSKIELIEPQSNQFRYAQACGKGEVEHSAVARAGYGFWIGSIDQRLDLCSGKRRDQRFIGLFHRDGPDAKRLIKARGYAIFEEAEERPNRRQPRIARSRRVAAILLDMIEERQDHGHADILDFQLRRQFAKLLTGEGDEQLKAVSVGVAGVRAGALVAGKMFPEKSGHGRGKSGHGAPA